jgi:cytochrome c-type biogenesis protein CcmH/NrfF
MTRWAAIIGAGLLAAVVAIVLLRPAPPATDADRAQALAAGLRCPDCAGLSVADSHSASAVAIRQRIDDLIATGATDDEIRGHFTDRYGDWVLLAPTAAAAWILPFAVVAAGIGGLGAWLLSRRRAGTTPPPVGEAERRRLHDEVEALDA